MFLLTLPSLVATGGQHLYEENQDGQAVSLLAGAAAIIHTKLPVFHLLLWFLQQSLLAGVPNRDRSLCRAVRPTSSRPHPTTRHLQRRGLASEHAHTGTPPGLPPDVSPDVTGCHFLFSLASHPSELLLSHFTDSATFFSLLLSFLCIATRSQ